MAEFQPILVDEENKILPYREGQFITANVIFTDGTTSYAAGAYVDLNGTRQALTMQGEQGSKGERGERGEKGDKGEQGPTGAQGEKGLQGDQGATGERGEKGDKGDTGAQGPAGPQGIQGVGMQGPQGIQGVQGVQGVKGDKGDPGPGIKFWYHTVAEMEADFNNAEIIKGDLAAINSDDTDEDGRVYVKGTAAWEYWITMKGVQGPQGEQGVQGIQGPQGEVGPQGEQGVQGPQGPQGEQGNGSSILIDGILVNSVKFSNDPQMQIDTLNEIMLKKVATVYGVRIDRNNSNPETAVVYTDGAVGFTPSQGNNGNFIAGSWDDKFPYNKIRPCLFKNGKVVGYLKPNNYALFEDGTEADIVSGEAGDVMIEIPKFYYKISQDDNYTYVQISDNILSKNTEGFTDISFSYNGEIKDKFYAGAYLGFVDKSGKLRSLSGKNPKTSQTIGAFRTAAQANGIGYEQLNFYKLTALQILYLIRFKNLNSQSALGKGFVGAGIGESIITGDTNEKGFNYGINENSRRVKCNGIEDFWGHHCQLVDGCQSTTNSIKTADGNFNDLTEGYIEYPCLMNYNGGFIKDIIGNNNLAFIAKDFTGSSSTYYSDKCFVRQNLIPYFGASYLDGDSSGAFYLAFSYSVLDSHGLIGTRLFYCG